MKKTNGPKILLLDIETSPIISYVWGLWENNVALNQIKTDWHLLSWSAKWLNSPSNKIMYQDQRNAKNIEDDRKLLEGIWDLLDKADIIITQNGKKFDQKKLNARFIINGFTPPSDYRHIDTLQLARKHFGFTSNKLEYLSKTLNLSKKKSNHKKYPGFELWKGCLAGEMSAWKEMEKYNKLDVLSLEELYLKLQPWGTGVVLAVHDEGNKEGSCSCGSHNLKKNGFRFSNSGKYQRYTCDDCGAHSQGKRNLLSIDKRKNTLRP